MAVDVVIAGSGPAGWALARACARRGLATTLVAPHPDVPWLPTYGLWADQAVDLPVPPLVVTGVRAGGRPVDRAYAVLDNAATVAAYARGRTPVVRDKAVGVTSTARGSVVHLDSGGEIEGAVVIDATGHGRKLTGGRPTGPRAEQSAVGVVLPAELAAPLVPPGTAVFMDDWDTADGLATFLYAVPLPGGRTLVEETSLAARPGVPADVLRARLARRLAAAGITAPDDARTERVRFPLDLPVRTGTGPVAFGSAAAMVHPATGYSVGDALVTAPAVAEAIARALPGGPLAAAAAARAAIWPRSARVVHALRRHGLRALLAMPAERVPEFFAGFFDQPAARQRAFLTGRADLAGTAAAMGAIFAAAPWPIRRRLVALR
ncbi:lycopene cyclase family protein [Actinokineospora sp. NPDC004072]